jgi:hypothetical protein
MGYTNASGHFVPVKRNGCMGCATDILFPDNHMSTLRRTHPRIWETLMRKGMATEIQRLQQARRGGQLSFFDVFSADELLDRRPCIFDRIDTIVLDDDTDATMPAYDPEAETTEQESFAPLEANHAQIDPLP